MLFVIDSTNEKIAVREARKLGIPVVAIVDTNCDPDQVDYLIPGNDDALRAIRLFANAIADAVLHGRSLRESAQIEEKADEEEERKRSGRPPVVARQNRRTRARARACPRSRAGPRGRGRRSRGAGHAPRSPGRHGLTHRRGPDNAGPGNRPAFVVYARPDPQSFPEIRQSWQSRPRW